MTKGTRFTATYWTSVFKPAIGEWRREKVFAELTATSDKMAEVTKATLEEAGSKRQWFGVHDIEQRETGARKRISSLDDIREIGV